MAQGHAALALTPQALAVHCHSLKLDVLIGQPQLPLREEVLLRPTQVLAWQNRSIFQRFLRSIFQRFLLLWREPNFLTALATRPP